MLPVSKSLVPDSVRRLLAVPKNALKTERNARVFVQYGFIVAHILGTISDPTTSILGGPMVSMFGPPGFILASSGSILVALGSREAPRQKQIDFRDFCRRRLATHLDTFWDKNHKQNRVLSMRFAMNRGQQPFYKKNDETLCSWNVRNVKKTL